MHLRRASTLAAAAALWWAATADATTVVRFTFDSLCHRAETIALVRCTEVAAFRDPVTGRIGTRTRLAVVRAVKGGPGDEIVLALPGGQLDGERTVIPGIPQFRKGQETVVFLTAAEDGGGPWPVGLDQGCYRTAAAEDGGRTVILQAGVTPLPRGALYKPASHKPFAVPLDAFLQAVQGALDTPPDAR